MGNAQGVKGGAPLLLDVPPEVVPAESPTFAMVEMPSGESEIVLLIVEMMKPEVAFASGLLVRSPAHSSVVSCDAKYKAGLVAMLEASQSTAILFSGTPLAARCFLRGERIALQQFLLEPQIFSWLPAIIEQFCRLTVAVAAQNRGRAV